VRSAVRRRERPLRRRAVPSPLKRGEIGSTTRVTEDTVIVPFSATDFLDRALAVYRDRIGVVDEPGQPAVSLGELTYGELGARAAAMAAKHDQLGIEVGDRVAFVSRNSARLLAAFFGVCGYGRVLVPVNFRLSAEEVATSSSTVAPACSTLTRSSRSTSPRSTASTSSCSATMTTCSRRVLNRSPGSTTGTRPRPSTTPRAPRLARRACRSPIATSGPTRSRSRCTPASPTGTSFCTRCRCFTPTAGGCRSR
jgi:hypothetical protein